MFGQKKHVQPVSYHGSRPGWSKQCGYGGASPWDVILILFVTSAGDDQRLGHRVERQPPHGVYDAAMHDTRKRGTF